MEKNQLEKISYKITKWIGTPNSIIAHTIFFASIFSLRFFNCPYEDILIILTTLVSLEAIYLAIFIQMTINRTTESLQSVEEDVSEIQKDVEEIGGDVEEISRDIDEIHEDVEDISNLDDHAEHQTRTETQQVIDKMEKQLNVILEEIKRLK